MLARGDADEGGFRHGACVGSRYTMAEDTPRQTRQAQMQQSMHRERFILTELGSKVVIA
jgi:hypothetical protein